jgi:hypothetical protein
VVDLCGLFGLVAVMLFIAIQEAVHLDQRHG